MSFKNFFFNRWVLVYFPYSSDRIFTRKRSKIYIAICWTLPILIMLPSLTGTWGWHALDCRTRTCTIMDLEEGYPFKKFLFNFGVSFPSLALVVTNVMIYAKVSVNFYIGKARILLKKIIDLKRFFDA